MVCPEKSLYCSQKIKSLQLKARTTNDQMNNIKLNSLLTATAIVVICEAGGGSILRIMATLSTIETVLVLRTVEIPLMAVVMILSKSDCPNPCSFNHLKKGVITGLVWSFYFAVAALIGGVVILFTTKTNPFLLFNSPIVSNLNHKKTFDLAIFLITGCIISPVAEELFFRGFVYSFVRKYGVMYAITISTLIFVLPHISGGNAIIAPNLFIPLTGGFVFALSYEYSKSLAAPVIIHILGNSSIFTLHLIFTNHFFH